MTVCAGKVERAVTRHALAVRAGFRSSTQPTGWAFPEPVEIVPRHSWFGGVKRFEIETNAAGLGTWSLVNEPFYANHLKIYHYPTSVPTFDV